MSKAKAKTKNEPIFWLPRFTVKTLPHALSETIDWGLHLLGVPTLWKQTMGSGQRIALLDTGASPGHEDLREAYEDIQDFTGSRSGPFDQQGHATHCAGIIAARQNNFGVVGVSPKAMILAGKVLGDNGSGSHRQIAAGVRWAIDKKVDIVSMSLGSSQTTKELEESIKEAIKQNIVVVAAAGNEGPALSTVGFPARYEGVISVGSIDRQRLISRYSSRGKRVDVVAPGQDITSCWPPNGLGTISGTSMACPFVAGVIALMKAKPHEETPLDSPVQIIEHLHRTALDLGDPGFDEDYGFGLIDPGKLLDRPAERQDRTQSWWMDFLLFVISKLGEKIRKGEQIFPADIERLKALYREAPK